VGLPPRAQAVRLEGNKRKLVGTALEPYVATIARRRKTLSSTAASSVAGVGVRVMIQGMVVVKPDRRDSRRTLVLFFGFFFFVRPTYWVRSLDGAAVRHTVPCLRRRLTTSR